MQQLDLFRLGFPLLVVLGLTYAGLRRFDLFEEDSARGTVALGTAFISVGSIYAFFRPGFLLAFSSSLTLALFVSFALVIALAVSGVDIGEYLDEQGLPAIMAVGIVMVGFFGSVLYFVPVPELLAPVVNFLLELLGGDNWEDVVQPALVLLFLLGMVYFVVSGGADESEGEE
jgi:ABC-type Fe3+-siderophore transport system permease subunit